MRRLGIVTLFCVMAVVLGVIFFWPTERRGAEAIAYGHDACAQCRMIISRPGFAGEIRNHAGVLFKYDDIGCLLRAMVAQRGEIPEAWVEDHATGHLVPLLTATLVRAEAAATPMGHGIVAFADADAARSFAAEQGGDVVALEHLVEHPQRLAVTVSYPADQEHP